MPNQNQNQNRNRKSLEEHKKDLERVLIQKTLSANDSQMGKTALALGINRVTLWKMLKRYGIRKPRKPR